MIREKHRSSVDRCRLPGRGSPQHRSQWSKDSTATVKEVAVLTTHVFFLLSYGSNALFNVLPICEFLIPLLSSASVQLTHVAKM